MRLHLRTVMGGSSALMVATVAAVTIATTATLAFSAINANGRSTVVAQCRAGVASADLIFARPREALLSIGSVPERHADGPLPATTIDSTATTAAMPDGPVIDRLVDEALAQQLRSGNRWYWIGGMLDDGSSFAVSYAPEVVPLSAKLTTVPRGSGARDLNVRVMVPATGKPLPADPGTPAAQVVAAVKPLIRLPDFRDPAQRARYGAILANATPTRPFWFSPHLVVTGGVFFPLVPGFTNVYHNGAPVGVASINMKLSELGGLLGAARATAGSHAFAVDQDGFLVAATATDAPYSHNFNISATHDVQPGCTATMATANVQPVTGIPEHGMNCRDHISVAKVMGGRLAAAAAEFPAIVADALAAPGAPLVRDSAELFVAAQPLPSLADNAGPPASWQLNAFRLVVLVVVPRPDVLGTASNIVPHAVLITAGTVLVFAAASFALVWAVLRPLRPVAERMGKAARLEDDDPPPPRSWLAEIFDLQAAFDDLAAELARVRSFVPQSLLRPDTTDDEDECEYEVDELLSQAESSRHAVTVMEQSSDSDLCSSQMERGRSMSALSDRSASRSSVGTALRRRRAAHRAAQPARTAEGVSSASISVLCVNLRGFHAALGAKAAAGAPAPPGAPGVLDQEALASTVAVVLQTATAQKGVVDSFHGDRFMVSFNASRPAAGHSARAARTAAALAEALPAGGLRLAPTQGLATGPALVGNVGCTGLKRFAAVGTVVPRAAALERLCKMHGATCLVSQRQFADLSTAVRLQTVDLVRLPGVPGASLVAAVGGAVAACDTAAQDEWMYQLDNIGGGASGSPSPGAPATRSQLLNAAWSSLASGNVAAASAEASKANDAAESSEVVIVGLDAVLQRLADAIQCASVQTADADVALAACTKLGSFYEQTLV